MTLCNRENLAAIAGVVGCTLVFSMLAPVVIGWSAYVWLLSSHRFLSWIAYAFLLPLTGLGLAMACVMAVSFRQSPPIFVLIPSIAIWLNYSRYTFSIPGTRSDVLVLLISSLMPVLICLPVYLYRRHAWTRIEPALCESAIDRKQPKIAVVEHLLYIAVATLNTIGVVLGFAGVAMLKRVQLPPFWDGLIEASFLCAPPPDCVVRFWDWNSGRLVIGTITCSAVFLAVLPRCRTRLQTFGCPVFLVLCAASGLMGLWIWSHAMIDINPGEGDRMVPGG
jgi:hypothetical protein